MSAPIRVLLADDHPVVCQGIAAIVSSHADMTVVGIANDGAKAVELFRLLSPDVVLMDMRMPGMSGVEAIASIRAEFPGARIAVMTTYGGDEYIAKAQAAGACGYLLKTAMPSEIAEAIRRIHRGQTYFPSPVLARVEESGGRAGLTKRETDVLRLVAKGLSNKEIASALSTTEMTIKSYAKSIFRKLGVAGRTEATTTAIQRGIIHIDDQ